MKYLIIFVKNLIIFLSFWPFLTHSNELAPVLIINSNYLNKIVNSIYLLEGGDKTKYPYGVRSIDTKGNKERARQICSNTVSNHWIRWNNWGRTNEFLISLSDRYCPPSADKIGNQNWRKNIKKMVDK